MILQFPQSKTGLCCFSSRFCMSCAHLDEARQKEIPKVSESQEESEGKMFYSMATKNGVQYRLGDGVFLLPDAFQFRLVCKLISAGTRGGFF